MSLTSVTRHALSKINRVLRSFAELELFNVGMRNRATGIVAESYRQISGAAAHDAIDKGDGALYHRGHIFGRGQTAHGITTIGLSSLSKIWRLEHTKLPELVQWCQSLTRDIDNATPFKTGIAIDHLDAGHDITSLPQEMVLAADWQDEVYRNTPLVRFVTTTGEEQSAPLLDFDLLVDYGATETDAIVVEVRGEEISTRLRCSLTPFPAVHYLDETQPRWQIERGFRRIDFVLYLTDNPLRFHFADGSLLEGCQLFQAPDDDNTPYDANLLMQPVAWDSEQVDIQREFGACRPPLCSIQEWLSARLVASDALVVFYDHRKGECADYLTLALDADG